MFAHLFFSRGTVVLLFFLIVFVGLGLFSLVNKSFDASDARKIAEKQAQNLQAKETELNNKISALETRDGQEAALKEQYQVVKDGEHVVVITEAEQSDTSTELPNVENTGGFIQFVKNLFK